MELFRFKEFEYKKNGEPKNRFIVCAWDDPEEDYFVTFSDLRQGDGPAAVVRFYWFNTEVQMPIADPVKSKIMSNAKLHEFINENTVVVAKSVDEANKLQGAGFFTGDLQQVIEAAKVKTRAEEAEEQPEEESKADIYSDLEFFDESALQLKHAPNIRKGVDAPYHHIPQAMKNGKLTSGKVSSTGHHLYKENAYSGTLQCSITCLTPGHFGNYQESLSKISQLNISGMEVLSDVRNLFSSTVDKNKKTDKKTVILPNFYKDNENSSPLAMINGSSIMGMLRNNVAALISAPMQRVAEKTNSYRPNLTVADDKEEPWHKSKNAFAATVEDISFDHVKGDAKRITVRLYSLKSVKFPKEEKNGTSREFLPSYEQMRYLEGIDSKHILKQEFKKNKDFIPYEDVGLKGEPFINRETSTELGKHFEFYIEQDVIQQFELTTEHLRDTKKGHLVSHHPHFGKAKAETRKKILDGIKEQRNLEKWVPNNKGTLLIYVEAEVDKNGKPYKIVSFGNHFRYYWLYKDSVRKLNNGLGDGELRPELKLDPNEEFKVNALPEQLNLARSLFGDVEQEDLTDVPEMKESHTFSKFAGKVSVNHALELLNKQSSTHSIANSQICFAMPRAGAPRPNAEHNLIQDGDLSAMSTWGWVADDPDTVLAGRKFYRHQRNSAKYQINPNELSQSSNLAEVFAPILNYVSPKGSLYRTSIRFKGLSPVELGILLITLQPDNLLKPHIQEKLPLKVKEYLGKVKLSETNESPVFAHKLGYGKPMGLGSVDLNIDSAVLLKSEAKSSEIQQLYPINNTDEELDLTIIKAIEFMNKNMLNDEGKSCWEKVLLPWIILHNFQNAPDKLEYPMAKPKEDKDDTTIVKYHSNVRNDQINQRRIIHSEKDLFIPEAKPEAKGEEPNHGLLKPHYKLKEALPEK